MSIANSKMSLAVDSCNSDGKISFILRKKPMEPGKDRKFDFDFRYYTPYHEGVLRRSGLYVFKTSDNDSTPYNHALT